MPNRQEVADERHQADNGDQRDHHSIIHFISTS